MIESSVGDPADGPAGATAADSPRNRLVEFSAQQDRLRVAPLPVAPVVRFGPDPVRVLMLGGGVLEGRGLLDHNLGLPGRVADRIVRTSGRGVDLDVVVEPDPSGRRTVESLPDLQLWRYGVVLLVLGEHHALTGTWSKQWEPQVDALLAAVAGRTSARILVVDTARAMVSASTVGWRGKVATANAERLGALTALRCGRDARVGYLELTAAQAPVALGGRFADVDYDSWAARLVARLVPDGNRPPGDA